MRTRRSFGATTNSTTFFLVFSPSFQLRLSLLAYASISCPSIEVTVATTSWMPDFASRSASFCSIAIRVAGSMILARSTTRPASTGRVRAKAAAIVHNNAVQAIARRDPLPPRVEERRPAIMSIPLRCGGPSEFYWRWLVRIRTGGEFRHRLVGAEEGGSPQQARECLEFSVVYAHCFDVVASSDRDAVFGALELRLERQEVLIGLEFRVVLANGKQPAERAGQLVLRILELLDLVGIGKLRNVQLYLCCFGARLHDRGQHFPFLFRETLNGGDQIG